MRARRVILQKPQIKVEHDMKTGQDFTHFLMTISEVTKEDGRKITINSANEFSPGITLKGVSTKPEFLADCFRQVADMIDVKFGVTIADKKAMQLENQLADSLKPVQ